MSKTYPSKKEPLRNAFRRTYSLQRRIRVQRYKIIYNLQNLQCTICIFFARRDIAEHLTDSKARGRYKKSTGWSLNGNRVVSEW